MISVADVRVEIGDEYRWASNPQAAPQVLASSADGALKRFYLRFGKALLSSVRVYFATYPAPNTGNATSWVEILSDDATNPWLATTDGNGLPLVLFTAAAPPKGLGVGSRYLMTAFTDAEIQGYLDRTRAYDEDARTLAGVHLAMMPAILARRDLMMVTRTGDVTQDPNVWASAQKDVIALLRDRVETPEAEDESYMGIGGYSSAQGYQR